jgi:TrmH family RNA methyltransferase
MNEKEIKRLTSLHVKKYRDEQNQFLIEGKRIVAEALMAGADILKLYSVSELDESMISAANDRKIPIENVDEHLAQKISNTVSPSGVLALCRILEKDLSSIQENENCIYLDCVSDPGNLGTIARAAAWFGVSHIVLSETCADPYNPKAVRAGMGAHFYCNFYIQSPSSWLAQSAKEILVADANGETIEKFGPISKPWVLVMGSEARGISNEILAEHYNTISIPKLGEGESLNVAVAAGIILSSLCSSKM